MKKIIAMLVLIVVAIVIGFSVKIGPDPVNVVKLCTQVLHGGSDQIDWRCDLP